MLPRVARAIDRHAVDVPIARHAGGVYVEGVWTPTAPGSTTIKATIQPTSGKERINLPEGVRDSAKWTIWSREILANSDELTIKGETHIILHVWERDEGAFYRAIAGEADGGS